MSITKFNTSTQAIKPAVRNAAFLAAKKSCVQTFEMIGFTLLPDSDTLRIHATSNGEDCMTWDVPVNDREGEGFSLYLPVSIWAFLKEYGNQNVPLSFSYENDMMTMDTDTGHYQFGFLLKDEIGFLPYANQDELAYSTARFRMDDLREAMTRTWFAMDDSGIRPNMRGVNVSVSKDKVDFIGASLPVISRYSRECLDAVGEGNVTLPLEAADFLKSMPEVPEGDWEVFIGDFGKSNVVFRRGPLTYCAISMKKPFPDCQRAFDKAEGSPVVGDMPVEAKKLKQALKRCTALSLEERFNTCFKVQDETCSLTRKSSDGTSASEDQIPVPGASKNAFGFALPASVLSGLTAATTGEVHLSIHEGRQAVISQPVGKDGSKGIHKVVAMLVNIGA